MSKQPFAPNSRSLIVLLGLSTALIAMGIDVLLPALPVMVRELGLSPGQAQLAVGLYIAGFALGQIGWGWLSDSHGRRPVMLLGTGGYAVATLLCAFIDSGASLLALRFVQGLFSSATRTASRAMLRDLFTGVPLARKMSAMTSVFFLSPLLAPQLGTLLLIVAGWRGVFWLPGLVAAGCFAVCWLRLAESHPKHLRRRSSPGDILHLAAAMVKHPLSGPCLALQAGMSIGLMIWISSSSLILVGHFDVPAHLFGLFFSATALVQFCGAMLCNRLLKRGAPAPVMALGASCVVVGGLLMLAVTLPGGGTLWQMMGAMWVYMLGFGLIVPASGGMALHAFGAAGGMAAALMGSIQSLSGSFGSALSAWTYDGTPRSLGIGIGLSAGIASLMALLLSRRLHRSPDLLGQVPDEPPEPPLQ